MRSNKLIDNKVMSEYDAISFLKLVRLAPSCDFPKTEAKRKPYIK